ncbi:unnamed protein product (macronuclear) [Paramecium tetraurelia]|uniref:Armadillo-type fold n=1 Tax=Paramecium tetraurelia TaxID=5888 RepID=A0D486_PARTE|nr:uncharacterized protein GSPATT00013319001 [Paramecium tetraurelia]CAK77853.1 unnamed protein product [Paramecium tetraurelia]|eukprot:XP_001445250.1 hypothetical protein (macronuclear) [Paramecium tetraurelia strain d4-2]
MSMEQKIEELNLKYKKLINDDENYNSKFTKNFQNFYQYAIAAGDADFSRGIQATKKLKKLIDTLYDSSKLTNQIIIKEAFYRQYLTPDNSIQILISTLLQSIRWQDNNAGIMIIIFYLESNYQFLDIKILSQIFKLHLTQYLEESEEMLQENTSKLLTLLMNQNDVFEKPEYLEIQEKLVQSMNSSLQLCDNFQDCYEVIINYFQNNCYLQQDQDNYQLIGLRTQKVDFSEKYISKIQLSPLLQILKELYSKTNINNFTNLLIKCCLINQKQTQLSAFHQLLQVSNIDQSDFIEVLRYSLLHNNIEIIKLGTQMAKNVIQDYECNQLQEIKLLIYLNQSLQPVGDISTDLIMNKFKIEKNDTLILRDNFKLILNICSILVQSEYFEFRVQTWRIMYILIKQQNLQDLQQCKKQIVQLSQIAKSETLEKAIYYFLYFIELLVKKLEDSDKNENLLFAQIICNFVGQFRQNSITAKILDIFNYFDFNDAQLLQLQSQSNVQDSNEIQQAWKELRQKFQQLKSKA